MKEGWKSCKWSDVLTIINGKNQKMVECSDGAFPIYGSGGIMGYANDWLCPENSVIIGRKGSINKPIFVDTKFWNVDTAFGLKADCNVLLPRFLYYFCENFNFEILNKAVTIPSLTKADLLKIDIQLPNFSEQQQIVEELDLLSGIIEKKKEQLKELDNLAQSIFYEMFGDPVANEKGFPTSTVGENVTDVKYGTSRPACENGKFKYLRMGNLTLNGHLDLTDLKLIDIPDNEIEKCIVRRGDILFNRTNSLELIGKTCMFDMDEPMVIAGYIIRVRFNEFVNPRFISVLFNMPEYKKLLKGIAKGAVNQANINSKELQSIRIILPPLSLQQSFASKIEAIEKEKALIKQSITETETLFNSRMDYYFG